MQAGGPFLCVFGLQTHVREHSLCRRFTQQHGSETLCERIRARSVETA